MTRTRLTQGLLLAAVAAAVVGCQTPMPTDEPTLAHVTVESPDEFEELWQATTDTLRDYYFRPDRQDRVEGIITTEPETSAYCFELWRPQPMPAEYWIESNVQTIQRQATVHITPADEERTYLVDVQIQRYRYSLEERQIDNSAAALRLYSSMAPTTSGERKSLEESAHWIALGRDETMERTLLSDVLERYGKITLADTLPEEFEDLPPPSAPPAAEASPAPAPQPDTALDPNLAHELEP